MDRYIRTKSATLQRYQSAFVQFFQMAIARGLTLDSSLDAFAAVLLDLHAESASQAHNAYSGLVMIPGLEPLKFSTLLHDVRKEWYASAPRYEDFWDPVPLVLKFASQPMPSSIEGIRLRLILPFLGSIRVSVP